ncbi:hypothetical protein HOG81_08725, partial [bacterium]|nr:hypothetical protein [bacterium]
MDVFEFIKEKRSEVRESTEQYRAILEPKFRSWSEQINTRITNNLNNPWISNLIPFDGSNLFNKTYQIDNENIKRAYVNIQKRLGEEIFIG